MPQEDRPNKQTSPNPPPHAGTVPHESPSNAGAGHGYGEQFPNWQLNAVPSHAHCPHSVPGQPQHKEPRQATPGPTESLQVSIGISH